MKTTYTDKEVSKIRDKKWKQYGLSGCCWWENIDELPLTENQKACVLEWVAQRLSVTDFAQTNDIWQCGKSYDPLSIDVEEKVAHSYMMDMKDGGRHHPFNKMSEIENAIFKEFFEEANNSNQQLLI